MEIQMCSNIHTGDVEIHLQFCNYFINVIPDPIFGDK